MWKALLKKQLLETLAFFTIGKNGKRRSPLAILGVAVLMGYVVVVLVLGVYEMAKMLCAPLALSGLSWVYFTLFSLMAWGLSCVLTIFTAKAKLYEAKDNRLLLSMPIPPWSILLSRMISLYLSALGLVALVLLPAVVCYWIYAEFTVLSLLFAVLAVAILPLGTLVISCLLGWLIAFVTARIRAKNLITTIFCVLFLIAYFIVYGKMNDYLTYILASGGIVGEKLGVVFPLRWLGLALSGEALPFLYFALVFIGAFAISYALLSATFLGVVTRETGVAKRAYKAKSRESKPVIFALFKKEWKRLFSNPMIVLNAALGGLFLLVLPFLIGFDKDIRNLLFAFSAGERALLVAGVVCLIATMNTPSASCISLEGENLWILRSSPVQTRTVFTAKLLLHAVLTTLPALVSAIALAVIAKLSVGYAILAVAIAVTLSTACGLCGLCMDLKMPNLHWTNELSAVKQSFSVVLAMLACLGAVLLPVGGFFAFGKDMPAWGYALSVLGFYIALIVALATLLRVWGEKKFEEL